MKTNKPNRIALVNATNSKRKSEKKGNIFSYPLYGRLLYYFYTAKKTKFLRADIKDYMKITTWSNSTKWVLKENKIIDFDEKKGGKNEFTFQTYNFRNQFCEKFIAFFNTEIVPYLHKSIYRMYRRYIKKSDKDLLFYHKNLKNEYIGGNAEYIINEYISRPGFFVKENRLADLNEKYLRLIADETIESAKKATKMEKEINKLEKERENIWGYLKEKEEPSERKSAHSVIKKTTDEVRGDLKTLTTEEMTRISEEIKELLKVDKNNTDTKDIVELLTILEKYFKYIGNEFQVKGKDYSLYDVFKEIIKQMGAEYRTRQKEIESSKSSPLIKKLYRYANIYQGYEYWNMLPIK